MPRLAAVDRTLEDLSEAAEIPRWVERSGRVMLLSEGLVSHAWSSACLSRSCQAYRSSCSCSSLWKEAAPQGMMCVPSAEEEEVLAGGADSRRTFQVVDHRELK